MTDTGRSIILIVLVLLLAAVSFTAGYLAKGVVSTHAVSASEEFDLLGEAWRWVETSYLGEIPPRNRVTYGAIRGAIGELGDPYTVFIEPPARDEERDSLRGSFGGIGANISRNEAGEVVLEPIEGNPAEMAGIQTGDILIAVDGALVGPDMTVAEIADLIQGEKGTKVVLTVRHLGTQDRVDIEVIRDDILIPSVSYRLLEDPGEIGYIQLTRFSGESGNEVGEAIETLRKDGATKLILDLRHNGGGLLDAAVDVADHFLDGGPVLIQTSKGEGERLYEADSGATAGQLPLVVLVDGGTASSSEIVAGALQDRGRAILVGSKTFGKGSVQLVYDLSDGSSVHVTASRWFTPSRHQIDEQGLVPDVEVEHDQDAVDDGRDLVLEHAIEYLKGEIGS